MGFYVLSGEQLCPNLSGALVRLWPVHGSFRSGFIIDFGNIYPELVS